MDIQDLNKIHEIELEILDVVDAFCRLHKIPYSLYCGTMLGAVRHGGFIPWDDDVDICMLRHDYDRFIKLWLNSHNTKFIIQNKTTNQCFDQSFTKIRKDHTTFLQSDEYAGLYHNGIFIDILPLDRIPTGRIGKVIYKWNLMNFLLFTREHVDYKSSPFVRFVSSIILGNPNAERRKAKRFKYLKRITQYNKNSTLNLVSANSLDGLRHEMPSDLPTRYKRIQFEDRSYMCYDNCDGLLTAWYGDYMTLPPEDQRVWKHKPVIIDFDNNINELGSGIT